MISQPESNTAPTALAQPVQPRERIEFVDILRGFALFGVLAMNMSGFAGYENAASYTEPLARGIMIGLLFLVQAKFYSLFSLLFGWGMAVQLRRSRQGFVARYSRRLLILLVFGALHGAFLWRGDILFFYATLGFLLLPFRKRPGWLLIGAALICLAWSILLQAPWDFMESFRDWYEGATSFMRSNELQEALYASGDYMTITRLRWQDFVNANSYFIYYIGNVFAMFLLGLLIGKLHLFETIYNHRRLLYTTLFTGLVVGASLNGIFTYASLGPVSVPEAYRSMLLVGSRTLGAPALTLFYVSLLIILAQKKRWYPQLAPLAAMGRMALTNYLMQSVLAGIVFYGYGLGLYGNAGPAFGLLLTVVIYILELRFSAWWFERYQYGPVEWLWRTLTYGRRQPLRIGVTAEDLASVRFSERVRNFIGQINSWLGLVLIWCILGIWTVALATGYLKLAAQFPDSLTIVVRVTATPVAAENGSANIAPASAGLEDEPVAEYLALPPAASAYQREDLQADAAALALGFDGRRAMDHIEILSTPRYAGRHAGSPGGHAAGDYLAAAFERYGLLPAGENGGYFQEFPVLYTPLAEVPVMRVTSPEGNITDTYRLYEDYLPVMRWYAGSGSGTGQVAWMDDCGAEDFLGAQVVGRLVLCTVPERPHWLEESTRAALEHGAVGLLLVSDPETTPADFSIPTKEIWVPRPLPTMRIYPHLTADVLAGSGWTLDELVASGAPQLLASEVSLAITSQNTGSCPGSACTARNVLGLVPGRDPEVAHQVVILGAHYDHMGQGPDGTYWPGANDDASGVGVLLEIARSWQEAGYQPRRTVLFAAWDAEELGLLGARYYTEHPRLPLRDTRAMIQLDMVGAPAEELSVGGTPDLATQLVGIARQVEVQAQTSELGGSDHAAFLEQGIPAAVLIFYDSENVQEHYHRPVDLPPVIDRDKLASVGRITSIAAVNLADSEPAIDELLELRARALLEGDWNTLQTITAREQLSAESAWLSDLSQFNPISVTLTTQDLDIHGNQAVVKTRVAVQYLEAGAEPVTQTLRLMQSARLAYQGGAWLWAGPDLIDVPVSDRLAGSQANFRLQVPALGDHDGLDMVGRLAEEYARIAGQLGLSPATESKIQVFPDRAALRASVGLSAPEDLGLWVTAGAVKMFIPASGVGDEVVVQAAAQLLMANYGLDAQDSPWLWHGLPLALAEAGEPGIWQPRFLPALQAGFQAEVGEQLSLDQKQARAWAAVRYLRQQAGWEGIGRLIVSLGQACQAGQCAVVEERNAAFVEVLGQDEQTIEHAWQADWRHRLSGVQAGLDHVLALRSNFLEQGDLDGWRKTVDGSVPGLLAEETVWWQVAISQTDRKFHWQATPVLLESAESVVAEVNFLADMEGQSEPVSLGTARVRFRQLPEGYLWAGAPLETYPGKTITLQIPAGDLVEVESWLAEAEILYSALAGQLGMQPRSGLLLSIYPDAETLTLSTGPPGDAQSFGSNYWTAPGQGVKISWDGGTKGFDDLRPRIAEQLALNLLYQAGLTESWLLQGISSYITQRGLGAPNPGPSAALGELLVLAKTGELPALFSSTMVDRAAGSGVSQVQAWDAVRYLVDHYGGQVLAELVTEHQRGLDAAGALQVVTGLNPEAFERQWQASLLVGHLEPGWQATVNTFDAEQSMQHIEYLASTDLAGRAAGTQGEAGAAQYIARQFQALGLQPVGQLFEPAAGISTTQVITPPIPVDSFSAYFQSFPISPTHLHAPPRFELRDTSGRIMAQFLLHEEFLGVYPAEEKAGQVYGALVLVTDGGFAEAGIEGQIAILRQSVDIERDLRLAQENGALGILYLGTKNKPGDLYARRMLQAADVAQIPVLELTQRGVTRFLETIGSDREQFRQLANGTKLSFLALLDYRTNQPLELSSSNVLGYIPGSDPQLSQECLILGAHYDHVGYEGNFQYSGANDNASGVAVLLEIARAWHESGYQPKRSVLFAAWGAQELGELGSRYYLAHPACPRQKTIAMLQMDGVGGGDGFKLGVLGNWGNDGLWLFALQGAAELTGETIVITDQEGESDHLPFHEAGLPAVLVSWRLANEQNLPDELAPNVHPDRLQKTGEIVALAAMALAR